MILDTDNGNHHLPNAHPDTPDKSIFDSLRYTIMYFFSLGFVTTSVLAADADQNNVFKCGIAVAPVTNWIYYDTIYTERYMGLPRPDDNLQGYQDSDVTAKADKFRNKKLLIVHGTAGNKKTFFLMYRQMG